jgi:DNA helicase-2/ATP-dependent DNA helicase PcrA
MQFRPGQSEVAEYKGGLLAVPAVPGAGKTTVLSWLAARIISEGLPRGSKVLVVTVMNSAVANFTRKIGDWLEKRNLPRGVGFEVRTLHSLALQIIRQRPDAALLRDDFAILDGGYRERLVEDVVDSWIVANQQRWLKVLKINESHPLYQQTLQGWRNRTVDMGKEMIRRLKALGISPGQGAERISGDNFYAWTVEFYREYQERLAQLGMVDFDDLLLRAWRMLEDDSELAQRLGDAWPYIFEDEAQDSNPLQQSLLLKLAEGNGNLVRVGDSNQAIMGTFTDSDPDLFREYARGEGVRTVPMLHSNRSSVDIIDLANGLVSWSYNEHPVAACRRALEPTYIQPVAADDPFPNPKAPGYTLAVRSYPDYPEEVKEVCSHAAGYVRRNPDKTVAILAPTNQMVADYRQVLADMEAPFYEICQYPAERRKTIDDLQAILNFLANPGDNGLLVAALERLVPELAEVAPIRGYLETVPVEQLLFSEASWPQSLRDFDLWIEVQRELEQLKMWLEGLHLPPDILVLEIANDLGLQQEELALAQKIAVDIKQWLAINPNWRLPKVAEEVGRMINSFLGAANVFFDRWGYSPQPGVINLVTAHRAKGLEWDTVYVVSVTSNDYPGLQKDKIRAEYGWLPEEIINPVAVARSEMEGMDSGAAIATAREELLSERLRLLYVAITRSKVNLLLTWHKKGRFGRQRPALALVELERLMEVKTCAK